MADEKKKTRILQEDDIRPITYDEIDKLDTTDIVPEDYDGDITTEDILDVLNS